MNTTLYRHFAKDGSLLYVGITNNPKARLKQHMKASSWIAEIHRVTHEEFEYRCQAEEAERIAIRDEKPKHNRTYSKLLSKEDYVYLQDDFSMVRRLLSDVFNKTFRVNKRAERYIKRIERDLFSLKLELEP